MDLNKAMIIGNLTRDPEVRTTPSGQSVANFSVATNRHWNDAGGNKQSAVEYHNIVVWGKLADICGQYLKKGRKAYFEGRLQTRDWEGQDGAKRTRTEIVVDNLIMLDGGRGAQMPGTVGAARPQTMDSSPLRPEGFAGQAEPVLEPLEGTQPSSKDEEIKVEDIPF